jgi:cytidylate kinase
VTATTPLPTLITFDGEARSGKGTIVQLVKDHLRDNLGYKVMLIDAGQVFRSLVVAATNRGVDMNDAEAIDAFLSDEESVEACVQFVKAVYHMEKIDREAILYTPEVSVASAKIGARPLSQAFKDELLKKWLRDARSEGFDIVLVDGRALEEVGQKLESDGLCDFILGLYFTCEPRIGAMRTLGLIEEDYDNLDAEKKLQVDELEDQIMERNKADRERAVQPIMPPSGAPSYKLPDLPIPELDGNRFMTTIDTSGKLTKSEMAEPVIQLVVKSIHN